MNKEHILGFIEGKASFTVNKSGNAYLFKLQINLHSTINNLKFLCELKHYLGDIGIIKKNKKSMHYIVRKHNEIKILVKYLGNEPFINKDKLICYKIWTDSFQYYIDHTLGKGRYIKLKKHSYSKISTTVENKMQEYCAKLSKIRQSHNIKIKKYNTLDRYNLQI